MPASSPPSSSSAESSASRWSGIEGRSGLWAAIGRIDGVATERWSAGSAGSVSPGRVGVAPVPRASDVVATALDVPATALDVPAALDVPVASRADRETITGRTGSDGPDEVRDAAPVAMARWTGISPLSSLSSPSPSSPSAARWIVVRSVELASGIGPAMVCRLTTGEGAAPIGRAAVGSVVGSPTPRRDAVVGSSGRLAAGSVEAPGPGLAAALAWRLTVGMAEREITVLDGARRMPPDGAGAGSADAPFVAGEAGAAEASAWEWPAWLRWTGGRTTDAAEVSGRSGTRIALRDTVGSERTGVISGAVVLVTLTSSSLPSSNAGLSSAAERDTTGAACAAELETPEVFEVLEVDRGCAGTAATGMATGSGS